MCSMCCVNNNMRVQTCINVQHMCCAHYMWQNTILMLSYCFFNDPMVIVYYYGFVYYVLVYINWIRIFIGYLLRIKKSANRKLKRIIFLFLFQIGREQGIEYLLKVIKKPNILTKSLQKFR